MLALRAVVADTQELRTAPHDAALPVLFIREQTRTGGFEPAVGHDFLLICKFDDLYQTIIMIVCVIYFPLIAFGKCKLHWNV